MKILILFSALIILNSMFFVYQADLNSYARESTYIKNIADECAAGAASFYDEQAASEGYYYFSRKECPAYVSHMVEESFHEDDNASFDINYYDTYGIEKPAIEVVITLKGRDRFRLPFLSKTTISRAGHYEISGY